MSDATSAVSEGEPGGARVVLRVRRAEAGLRRDRRAESSALVSAGCGPQGSRPVLLFCTREAMEAKEALRGCVSRP